MEDFRTLKAVQLDALREVANIGAGHAATALSTMTGSRVEIKVPTINIARLEDVPPQISAPEEPVAAVLMKIFGDLAGHALLVFPTPTAVRLAELMARKPRGTWTELGVLQQSAIQEAGNILSGAYVNALSEFMEMIIMISPPSLAVDMSAAVLTTAYLQFPSSAKPDYVVCVESEFYMKDSAEQLRGFFLLMPDADSLNKILRVLRVA